MSNSTALALITASFLPAFFCFHYITKLANDVAMEIETGVVRGVPISSGYRRIMLYQIWSGYGLGHDVRDLRGDSERTNRRQRRRRRYQNSRVSCCRHGRNRSRWIRGQWCVGVPALPLRSAPSRTKLALARLLPALVPSAHRAGLDAVGSRGLAFRNTTD